MIICLGSEEEHLKEIRENQETYSVVIPVLDGDGAVTDNNKLEITEAALDVISKQVVEMAFSDLPNDTAVKSINDYISSVIIPEHAKKGIKEDPAFTEYMLKVNYTKRPKLTQVIFLAVLHSGDIYRPTSDYFDPNIVSDIIKTWLKTKGIEILNQLEQDIQKAKEEAEAKEIEEAKVEEEDEFTRLAAKAKEETDEFDDVMVDTSFEEEDIDEVPPTVTEEKEEITVEDLSLPEVDEDDVIEEIPIVTEDIEQVEEVEETLPTEDSTPEEPVEELNEEPKEEEPEKKEENNADSDVFVMDSADFDLEAMFKEEQAKALAKQEKAKKRQIKQFNQDTGANLNSDKAYEDPEERAKIKELFARFMTPVQSK